MQQDAIVTGAQFAAGLVNGAVLAALFVGVMHLVARRIGPPCGGATTAALLFFMLLIAAFGYVAFAAIGRAGPLWVLTELGGVLLYGAVAWRGLRGPAGWLVAAWALHPFWDMGLHYWGAGRAFVSPLSWPIPCLSFDLLIAFYVAFRAQRTPWT